MLQGNKGEWSEVYTLLKLLGDGKLFSGDKDLNKLEDLFYPIIKILRDESDKNIEYEIEGDVIIVSDSVEVTRFNSLELLRNATALLKKIKSEEGSFKVPEIERFLNLIHCNSLKAKSSKKTDIRIVIHDLRLDRRQELGFSIKSQLGGDSTLLNAGKTTNFIFRVDGFIQPTAVADEINKIETRSKIKDRLNTLKDFDGQLNYFDLENPVFKNNLILIDSLMPEIIAELVKLYYTSGLNSIKQLVEEIKRVNPLNFDSQFAHKFYEYKIKRFLMDVALGMMPAKVWDGNYDTTGGYLIVKEDGEVLCYHVYDRNQFEDYLYNNTKLETASSTRHEFGKIYQEIDRYFIKLNLQIRFN